MNTINLSLALSGLLIIALGYFVRKSKVIGDQKQEAEGVTIMFLGAISLLIAEIDYFKLFGTVNISQNKFVVILMLLGFLSLLFGSVEQTYPFHNDRSSAKIHSQTMIVIGIVLFFTGLMINLGVIDLIIRILSGSLGFSY